MKKYFLLLLFLTLLVSEMFGLRLGISQGLSVKNLLLYLLVMLTCIQKIYSKDKSVSIIRIHFCFLMLISIALISWFFTELPQTMLLASTKEELFVALKGLLIDHYLFFLVFYYCSNTKKDVIFLIKSIIILVALSTLLTIIDVYDMPNLGIIKQMEHSETGYGRVQGPLGEPNQYAAFLILFIPVYVALIKTSAGLFRYFCLFSLLLMSTVLILTGSRGGVFGLLLGTLIGAFMFRNYIGLKQFASFSLKTSLVTLGAIAIALYKYTDVILNRVVATTQAGDIVSASAGRLWIWEQGINQMLKEPFSFVIGQGWNTYAVYVGIVSHNTYLTILFELGLLGFIPFMILIFSIILTAQKGASYATQEDRILIGGFVFGFLGLLISVFFVNLFNPWFFIWSFIGLMTRFSILSLSNRTEQNI